MTMKPHVLALCDKLVANDPTLNDLNLGLNTIDDAELKLILEATKENKVVKKVYVSGSNASPLSVHAALSLASVVSVHPEIQDLAFFRISIAEFGPIALAFHQNRKLTRLSVDNCYITLNLMECIRWLLMENALESLALTDCRRIHSKVLLDISRELLSNKSLKELVLHNEYNFSSEIMQAVPRMLRSNQDLETISLVLTNDMDNKAEIARRIAQAAEGHKSLKKLQINCLYGVNVEFPTKAIGNMLQNTPSLRELFLSGFRRMGPTGARHVADGLRSSNSNLKELGFCKNGLGDEEASYFAGVVETSPNLQSVSLSRNSIGDAGASALAIALSHNHTLQVLKLDSNQIGGEGASALADALRANVSLNMLKLSGNPIGDDGATSIAEMLTSNLTIETVHIEGFGVGGLQAFATCLSRMRGLKTLDFNFGGELFCDVTGFTPVIGNAFVQSLEQNTTLEKFDCDYMELRDSQGMSKVNRLLALNRGGRRLVSATGESIPPLNYWPRILAKSCDNADVLFYFLREKTCVLASLAGSRKRKRCASDETKS